jgi:hypothetical protein
MENNNSYPLKMKCVTFNVSIDEMNISEDIYVPRKWSDLDTIEVLKEVIKDKYSIELDENSEISIVNTRYTDK